LNGMSAFFCKLSLIPSFFSVIKNDLGHASHLLKLG
jgi:hypothetical protein